MAASKKTKNGKTASPALKAAVEAARLADERRGRDIIVLYVENVIVLTDYFVIVSARNKRQIQATGRDILKHLRQAGFPHARMEGFGEASWVLIDAGSIVVHIFREDLRSYYDLELLWGDAPEIDWKEKKD